MKGIYKFPQGPYSDAFEHHYVAAVLLNTPESKFFRHELLTQRVLSDLLYYSKVFVEQCRDKGLRGYWTLNEASDKGVPVGSGSWQSRSYLRACILLERAMTAEQRQAWREGAKWLMAALTVDGKETFGPWWSSNKVADHLAAVGQWLMLSGDPEARKFLERQFAWFWRAFPEEGCADKYHNYFVKTMYRLAPIVLVPEAQAYHEPFVKRIRMWRSFLTPHALYDGAEHPEPNNDEIWKGKLGPLLACLLLASPDDPELASVAAFIVKKRLADQDPASFWPTKFDAYFGQHWGSLGLILETYPRWQKPLDQLGLQAYEQMRFFDYWSGLGRVAVMTGSYQASCYPHWAWTWDYATYGGLLFRLNTPGEFQIEGHAQAGRCWLDWDTHRDPETGADRTGIITAIMPGGKRLGTPPYFPDEVVVSGAIPAHPGERLYGFTHCRYKVGEALEISTDNVFLEEAVLVFNTIHALQDAAFDSLYVQQPFANPGDLSALTSDGQVVTFEGTRFKPKASVAQALSGPFDLRSQGGSMALAFVPLANNFTRQELVDVALFMRPKGDVKRIPHRVAAWRGYLPGQVKKGDVFLADFAYLPHGTNVPAAALAANFESVPWAEGHGVRVKGTNSVIIGLSPGSAKAAPRLQFAGLDAIGKFFAVELTGGKAQKICLDGTSLFRGGQRLVQMSRRAAATLHPASGQGTIDAGLGPIDVVTPQKSYHLFSANHEFLERPLIAQSLSSPVPGPAASPVPEVEAACRRFNMLPARFEVAAPLAEVEMLLRSAEARGAKDPTRVRAALAKARQALNIGELKQAQALVATAKEMVLEMHQKADQANQAVAPIESRRPESPLLPPKTDGPDHYDLNYLISFAEQQARESVKRRAEALLRSLPSGRQVEVWNEKVRATEHVLLTRYLGLPIHWTREHIPGQPDFFWRPYLKMGKQFQPPANPWEGALVKYLLPNDQQWLALARLEAAAKLIPF